MASATPPTIRWGILGTGWVSSRFARDLFLPHPSKSTYKPVNHTVTALATSSEEKGASFFASLPLPAHHSQPKIYTNYADIYSDNNIDVIYIGTPHSYHKDQSIAAITAGKHVLCEKPFCINHAEAAEVIEAARAKGVFIMEAVWTRFFPIVRDLHRMIHEEKIIGKVSRMFCDFGNNTGFEELPASHRYKDLALGAGALLDLGIYPLTLANVVLDGKVGKAVDAPDVNTTMLLKAGVDVEDVVTLKYTDGRLGVLTAGFRTKSAEAFGRVEGTEGTIVLEGPAASLPARIRLQKKGSEDKVLDYGFGDPINGEKEPMGFRYEADAVAWDVLEGRKENEIMPWEESLRMMKLMDTIRKQGGLVYPQDESS